MMLLSRGSAEQSPSHADFTLRACCLLLLVLSAAAIAISWRWPFVGDEGILHYIVFLMTKGFRPYVDIKDVNLPGSYLMDWLVMRELGADGLGEHLYDLLLCALGAAAAVWAALPDRRRAVAALAAVLLFVILHLQDGLMQIGQRDLAMAVFALSAYAVIVCEAIAPRHRIVLFSFLVGLICTIKPTLLTIALMPLLVPSLRTWLRRRPLRGVMLALAGFAIAPLLTTLWLCWRSAFGAFLHCLGTLETMHAAAAHRSLGTVFHLALTPGRELMIAALVLLLIARMPWTTERRLLAFCAAAGLISCAVQGKGLPYHRYTFLLFALLLLFDGFASLTNMEGWRSIAGMAGIAVFTLALAPAAVWRIAHFSHAAPFEDALARQLVLTGGSTQRSIQCLDTFAGCDNTLYRMRLVQSTGYLYDCYLAMPGSTQRDRYRSEFLAALEHSSPHTIVITDQPCFALHQGYQWVNEWGALESYLDGNYRLAADWRSSKPERWWSRAQTPPAFRIYIHR